MLACLGEHGVLLQVGNQFVDQYYNVMKSSPRYLHRFYTDESTFTYVDPGVDGQGGQAFTVNNQKVGD